MCCYSFHDCCKGPVETGVSHTGQPQTGQGKQNHRDLNEGRGRGMCQKKNQRQMRKCFRFLHTKGNKITKAVKNFTTKNLDLRNCVSSAVHLSIDHLLCKTPLLFRHSFWDSSSSLEHLHVETLQLVNSKVQHVHTANDLHTTLIVILSSSGLPFCF